MILVLLLLLVATSLEGQQYRAFWADGFNKGYKSPAQIDQMVEDLAAAKANAVFVQMRRRGDSYYLHSLEPPAQDPDYSPSFDALDYLIFRAHTRGIEVHAWFNVGPVWAASLGTPQDPRHVWLKHGPRASGDDMWMTVSSKGAVSQTSVDLGHPDVARYTADVILEPAKYYDLDGIHLDYVRYPEDADYGWNPKAVERFQRLENRTAAPDPSDPKWSDFRRKQVTDLVRQIYLRAYAIRPSIKISAALITWGDGPRSDEEFRRKDAYRYVFQDWPGWLQEGILDLGIPMNYFAQSRYSSYLDHWLEYEKDRQYGRALLVGLGVYLNSIPDSMDQLRRALAPSSAGNRPLGVNFYSYANTNIIVGGAPAVANSEFYRAAGEAFGEPAPPPLVPWKAKPERGQIYGWLTVEPGPAWLKDSDTVWIESDTGGPSWRTLTDGTGFFGALDLPPDRYRVRILRGGQEIYRTVAQDLQRGTAVLFHIFLKPADFSGVLPVLGAASKSIAAPGDLLVLSGSNLASESAFATAVPLPMELAGTQVVVNGTAAPLFSVSPNRIELQLPYLPPVTQNILVRRAGLESAPLELSAAPAAPAILGFRRMAERYVEIYASGLGVADPPVSAGLGGAAQEPYNRTVLPVVVRLRATQGEFVLQPLYAGLAPYLPGRYQVNIQLPEGVAAGELRLQAGEALSQPVTF